MYPPFDLVSNFSQNQAEACISLSLVLFHAHAFYEIYSSQENHPFHKIVSQPNSEFSLSLLVKCNAPVTIFAALYCNFSNLAISVCFKFL